MRVAGGTCSIAPGCELGGPVSWSECVIKRILLDYGSSRIPVESDGGLLLVWRLPTKVDLPHQMQGLQKCPTLIMDDGCSCIV